MGRRNSSYSKSLHQQAYEKLTSMQAFGEAKKDAIADGTDKGKIFSYSTYQTYWKHIKYFIHDVKEKHPDCTTMKKARAYVSEWLEQRENATIIKDGKEVPRYSAWTIQTEAKALGKYYGISPDDKDYFHPPERHREDIKRSRVDTVRDRHFSVTNNSELINFARGTGLRRQGLSQIKGDCLFKKGEIEEKIHLLERKSVLTESEKKDLIALKDTRHFTHQENFIQTKEKGGKIRYAPIIGPHERQIVDRIRGTPEDKKVWEYVSSNADIHGYRSDYATALYKEYARDIDRIPYDKINRGSGKKYQSDVYVCRLDEKGKKLDRKAMLCTSKALGHNRISIVAENYLRGI